jgi:hypothetical protein
MPMEHIQKSTMYLTQRKSYTLLKGRDMADYIFDSNLEKLKLVKIWQEFNYLNFRLLYNLCLEDLRAKILNHSYSKEMKILCGKTYTVGDTAKA